MPAELKMFSTFGVISELPDYKPRLPSPAKKEHGARASCGCPVEACTPSPERDSDKGWYCAICGNPVTELEALWLASHQAWSFRTSKPEGLTGHDYPCSFEMIRHFSVLLMAANIDAVFHSIDIHRYVCQANVSFLGETKWIRDPSDSTSEIRMTFQGPDTEFGVKFEKRLFVEPEVT